MIKQVNKAANEEEFKSTFASDGKSMTADSQKAALELLQEVNNIPMYIETKKRAMSQNVFG